MFRLYTLEDNIRIEPQDLGKPTSQAITEVLERTFIDRVVRNVGLVVTLYDVLGIGEGALYHSDGGVHYKVSFRVVAFCPFVNELLTGTVKEMNEEGLFVSLGFFDDIHIPRSMLPQPAVWKSAEREWAWRVEDGDQELFFGRNAEIRFRVDSVDYPPLPSLQAQAEDRAAGNPVLGTAERPHVPMAIVGRADATGLGMTAWGWE